MRPGQDQGAAIVKFGGGQVVLFAEENGQLQVRLGVVRPRQKGFTGRRFRRRGLAAGVQHLGQVVP